MVYKAQGKTPTVFPLTLPKEGLLKGELPVDQIGPGTHDLLVRLYTKSGLKADVAPRLEPERRTVFMLTDIGVTDVRPTRGLVGDSVWIYGTGLGTVDTVTINGVAATVTRWDVDSLDITVPVGATSGDLIVTSGKWQSKPVPFEVITLWTCCTRPKVPGVPRSLGHIDRPGQPGQLCPAVGPPGCGFTAVLIADATAKGNLKWEGAKLHSDRQLREVSQAGKGD